MNETKRSFNVRKALLGLLALALVAAISVTATLALLQKNTTALTNTFVAIGGLLDETTISEDKWGTTTKGKFVLYEHELTGAPGNYELSADNLILNGKTQNYSVVPGVNVPKDPTVHLENITSDVIMFVEIVDGQNISTNPAADALSYTVDSNWKEVPSAVGKKGGTVYVYTGGQAADIVANAKIDYTAYENAALDAHILAKDEIVVGESVAKDKVDGSACKLEIYAYLTQYAGMDTDGNTLANVFSAITLP